MSHKSNQVVSTWKDIEKFLTRCTPTMYDATTPLTDSSRLIVRDALMLWYLATVDTLALSESPFTDRIQRGWITSFSTITVFELVELLKEGAHQLVAGDYPNYDAFKQHLSSSYSSAGIIMMPVKREIDRWFLRSETDALNLVYSWFCFITRLNLNDLTVLKDNAMDKYLRLEELIQEDGFSQEEVNLLQKWFPRSCENEAFFIEGYSPSHGPGSTADAGSFLLHKYLSLGSDQRLEMLIHRVYADQDPYPRQARKDLRRVSKTIFVPKTLTSYRTISMESASLMWHQKGVRSATLRYCNRRVPSIARRYQPDKQEPNRDLAWEGSVTGNFATIDLSSASDTVSWCLVKQWFRHTLLYPWLLWTRSTHSELPDGRVIKLKKYAPMGSDLCFPIETICFIAMAECSIVESGGDPKTSRFRVFGDDIVIEEEYVPALISRLTQNGFTVNTEKTFWGRQPKGFFRESCGGFYFDGVDITPVRLSRKFLGYASIGVHTPNVIESLINLSNECNTRYPSVRRWCVDALLHLPRHLRPPFSSSGDVGLFSKQPTNFHLLSKDSKNLQSTVYTYGVTGRPAKIGRLKWEDIRMFEYFRAVGERSRLTWPEDRVDVDISPNPTTSWKSKRSPLYD